MLAMQMTPYPIKRELVPNAPRRTGKVRDTIALLAQLTVDPKELPNPRMRNGNISPIIVHITGPHVAEKKAM